MQPRTPSIAISWNGSTHPPEAGAAANSFAAGPEPDGVLVVLLRDGHGGGLSLLQRFVAGAVQPCIDPIVLGSLLNGLQITLVIAVMSWGISSVLGVGLGLLSSSTFWEILAGVRWPALILRRWLTPLRAVHELIWGLLLLQVFGLNGWVAVCAIAIPYTVLMARVIADQVDCHVSPAIPVLKGAGATPWAVMLTAGPTAGGADQRPHRPPPRLRTSFSLDSGCFRPRRTGDGPQPQPALAPISGAVEWALDAGHRHGGARPTAANAAQLVTHADSSRGHGQPLACPWLGNAAGSAAGLASG